MSQTNPDVGGGMRHRRTHTHTDNAKMAQKLSTTEEEKSDVVTITKAAAVIAATVIIATVAVNAFDVSE